ncbi:SH3 domain-containing protein [Sporolactobacillus pectinivorans]|uniref:SH3 domain-containing protein n=1 Tax=Sporolactobacillus pectinivorans TaxID=1591408 RepID=UPI000C267CF7|nr:SH3 domain-containing protein [Sporolactobacillus pectinivorans]
MTPVQLVDAKKMDSSFLCPGKTGQAVRYQGLCRYGWVEHSVTVLSEVREETRAGGGAPKPTFEKTEPYIVVASLLYIRKAPNGPVVGKLKQGQQVEVESISNGWAQIKSGTGHVYVGTKLLKKK